MGTSVWKGVIIGGTTGVVVSAVWSYRRDDTVDMALGRAARMGAALAGTGAVVGLAVDRRRRRRARRRSAALSLEQAREALTQAAVAARPRVEQAVEVARPRVEHALEVARPRVEQAVEVARPRVVHAVGRAAKVTRPHAGRMLEFG